ncbi:MAG: leucyl aminopeptidase family protein, partial [Nocardioides sp.]|nr:leucyl aminopeptidase family protein [Nocardioides sp.]
MTTYILRNASPAKTKTDAVIVGVVKTPKGPVLAGAAEDVTKAYGRKLKPLLQALSLTGASGELAKIPTAGAINSPLLVLIGLGEEKKVDATVVRRAAGTAARSVGNAASVALALPSDTPELVGAATEGFLLGGYTFETYKRDSKSEHEEAAEVVLLSGIARKKGATAAFERAQLLAESVAGVRDWVNTPANDLNPPSFAEAVTALHGEVTKGRGAPKVGIEVWDEKKLADEGCGGILGVGGGSETPPRLVKLTWNPSGAKSHIALVGKGVTYDSGGYTIKPAQSMV